MEAYITKNQAIHAMEQVTQPECFIEDTRKNFARIIEELPAADVEDNQLEVIVENGENDYSKHFVGLSDNVTYVIEDVEGADVENTKYTLNFNPDMWIPANVKTID